MSTSTTHAPAAPSTLTAPRPPAGRPNRRLRSGRTFRWVYDVMAVFMAAAAVGTAILHEWPGVIICGIAAPVFWGMSRWFKRAQLAIYGSELWERDILGRWRGPLDLTRLEHVAFVRTGSGASSRFSLLLRASAPLDERTGHDPSPGDRIALDETRISLKYYSRRAVERLIAPWVAGKPGVASDEVARLFELRVKHPRTAGIRMLFSRG